MNLRIPNYSEYQDICSSVYYPDLEAIEFARRSYEEMNDEEREEMSKHQRP